MGPNLTWDHAHEKSLILALAGHGFGDTLEEAWPALKAKKSYDAKVSAGLLELAPHDVVAEIGTGVGIVADILAPRIKHYHCVDISKSFLDVCRRTTSSNPNISYHLVTPGDLSPLRGTGVTKIFSEGVFIHFNLFDTYIYLKQIADILPSGGRLTFNIINAEFDGLLDDPVWQEQVELYRRDKTIIVGLMSWLSPLTVQTLLKRLGFSVAQISWPDQQYVHFTVIKP